MVGQEEFLIQLIMQTVVLVAENQFLDLFHLIQEQVIVPLQVPHKGRQVEMLIVVVGIDQVVEEEQFVVEYPLQMETLVDKVEMVVDYLQLLDLMVYLAEVLDIMLVVEAEQVTVEVDYLGLLEEKVGEQIVVVMVLVLHLLDQFVELLIVVVAEVELVELNLALQMVGKVDQVL